MKSRADARREQRRPAEVSATVSIDGRGVAVRTRDVSRLGVCLISDTEIPCDTELKMDLVLALGTDEMSEPLSIMGRAIWCTPMFGKFQIGVMFIRVDPVRRRFLDLFIRFIDGEISPTGHEPRSEHPASRARPEDKDDPFRP